MPLSVELLRRGQARFDIYCQVCHDGAGTGDGIAIRRGMVQPPNLSEARIRAMPLGELFQVITEGRRNMPPYAAQIPVNDRWAIAAYVRVLQYSHQAPLEDIPGDVAAAKGWRK